ncbi:MAG: sialate O-acetylesterase [Clostridia bacterium]|nr:sialate O-acetylesterase [Clostridia bacterium]
MELQYPNHSFVLMGQSNMAGRGLLSDVEKIDNDLCFMYRMMHWIKMEEPINLDALLDDEFASGVGLSASFADTYAKTYGESVGLIPCAKGGAKLSLWMPGTPLFEQAVLLTKFAMQETELKGILWHQGESDCRLQEDFDAYPERFLLILTEFRNRIGRPDLPIVIGEISNHISDRWGRLAGYQKLNETLHALADQLPNCAIVDCGEFPLKPDGIHFNAESLRKMGNLYFEKYQELVQK